VNFIDVILVTWPNHPRRLQYFRRTVRALAEKLTASRHELRWLCSSESARDPDSTWHGDELAEFCAKVGIKLHWREGPPSLGAGMNAAARLCMAPVCLLVQDDYELLEPLDLSPGAELLAENPQIDLVRFCYFCHPQYGTQFVADSGHHGWQRVNIRGYWPYGDDPQMRRRDFHAKWGWYLEGGQHGVSEGDMLWRLVRGEATIFAADRCYFGHFGEVAAVPESQEHRERAVTRSQPCPQSA
jgi:hypothetical protein